MTKKGGIESYKRFMIKVGIRDIKAHTFKSVHNTIKRNVTKM
jgi:hypothetical protein